MPLKGSKHFFHDEIARYKASPLAKYRDLIRQRMKEGLLEEFTCARCSRISHDPCGWDGPGRPLCAACADGMEVPPV